MRLPLGAVSSPVITIHSVTDQFTAWIDTYEKAWRTEGIKELGGLFTDDASYQAAPFDDPLVGLAAIAKFWDAEREGPDETFTMQFEIVAAQDLTAVARINVVYGEPPQRTYRDLWVITLAEDGRCRAFEEWPFHPGQARTAF